MSGPWEQYADEEAPTPAPAPKQEVGPWGRYSDAPSVPPEYDPTPMRNYVKSNLDRFKAEQAAKPDGGQKVAENFIDAISAGLDMSVMGLTAEAALGDGKINTIMPENASMAMNIAYQLSSIIPDLPLMGVAGAIGGITGGAIGTAVAPGVGTVAGTTIGFGAGSMAIPAAMRQMYMDHFEKGDIKDFNDFWERLSATTIAATKEGVVGGLTAGVGGLVGSKLATKSVNALGETVINALTPMQTTTKVASEIATMVTVGKGLQGEMPELKDFTEAAILIGGLHGVGLVTKKLSKLYAEKGIKPTDVLKMSESDPTIKQDMMAENVEMPRAFDNVKSELPAKNIKQEIPAESQALKPVAGTSPEFSQDTARVELPKVEEMPKPKQEVDTTQQTEVQGAVERVLGKVANKAEKSNIELAKEYAVKEWKNLYTNYVDRFNPINQAVKTLASGEGIEAAKNAYDLARTTSASAVSRYMMEFGQVDFKTREKVGASFKEILKPVNGELDTFSAYLVSRRAVELYNRGIENPGFARADAEMIVKAFGPKYEAHAKAVTDFNNSLLKYLADSGVVSKDAAAGFVDAHQNFVPFKRLIENMDGFEAATGKTKSRPIKELKGVKSEDTMTQNPLYAIAENVSFYTRLAETNRVKAALIEQANAVKGQDLIKQVPQSSAPVRTKSPELLKFMESNGLDPNDVGIVGFSKINKNLGENQFDVMIDGKRVVYETTPELATAIRALGGAEAPTNVVFKIARGVSSTLRGAISITPDFILRNFFRDQVTMQAFSKYGTGPIDTLKAVGELLKPEHSEVYQKWLVSGGASGTFFDLNKSYLEKDIFNLSQKTGLMDKAWNVLSTPVHYLKLAGELTEQATRLAEFTKTTSGDYSMNKLVEGAFNASEVTVDFRRMGAKMSALNAITAFQNVAIQGLDRTVRAAKDNPAGLAKGASLITAASVFNWYANKDDERYQDLPQWQKDLFWVITTDKWETLNENDDLRAYPDYLVKEENGKVLVNKGTIYRLPKPQELGLVFGSLVERTLDAFHNDNIGELKHLGPSAIDMITPSLVPNIVAPFVETWANKSLFTGNPIVSAGAEKLLPEYRYTEYTSETAKKLSSAIATIPGAKNLDIISPVVIDNWVTAWTGNLGNYALMVVDKMLPAKEGEVPINKPDPTLSDIPFVKAFVVRHPSSGTQVLTDFYDEYNKYEQSMNTIRKLQKQGDFEEAQKELEALDSFPLAKSFGVAAEAMAKQRKVLRAIYRDENMTGPEKRQQIDGLYYMMNKTAKEKLRQKKELEHNK